MAKKVKPAIRPSSPFATLPTFVRDQQAQKKGVAEEEIILAGMAESKGWQIIEEFIDSILDDLDQVNEAAIASGAKFAEIGRNTLVISMTKGIIKKITDKVADAKEARDKELDDKAKEPAEGK